jgi:gamma-glutamylcyclotransferase
MFYFAYGSNMSAKRLYSRIGYSTRLEICSLPGYQLLFHKKGQDGSGKCDAWRTNQPCQQVLGVLYLVAEKQIEYLDSFENEGNGYLRKTVKVFCAKGSKYYAQTYLAQIIDPTLKPFHWYKQHVIAGASEAGLPDHYIETIANTAVMIDEDDERTRREMSIYCSPATHLI